jgi:hypothetical protein
VRLKWAHYCLQASPNGWGVDVVHKLDSFGADPGKPPELPDVPLYLAVRVHAPDGAGTDGHVLDATIKDSHGQPLSSTQSVPLKFIALPHGYPLIGLGQVPINEWKLPPIGRYSIDLAVAGDPIGGVPLLINPRRGRHSLQLAAGTPALRLNWAHYLMMALPDSRMPGFMNLAGIFEFLPRSMGSNLKGSLLLLHIESDLTIHTQHELRTELLDGNNQPARDRNGLLLMPDFVRPITLRRLTPAWDFLVSTATVRFENDISLAPGEYHFRFFLDGSPFGDPLDLTVLPE